MKKTLTQLRRFLREEDGPTAIEYAIMLSLIIMVCIASVSQVGSLTSSKFTPVANALK